MASLAQVRLASAGIAAAVGLALMSWSAAVVAQDDPFGAVSDHLELSGGVESVWECVEKHGLTAPATNHVERFAAQPDIDAFVAKALALLRAAGQSDTPATFASELADQQLRVAGVMQSLVAFSKLDVGDDMRSSTLQMQAAALLALRYAALADGACAPPTQLLELMQRIENEHYPNPRPRNPG
jgi:hypothetical protein